MSDTREALDAFARSLRRQGEQVASLGSALSESISLPSSLGNRLEELSSRYAHVYTISRVLKAQAERDHEVQIFRRELLPRFPLSRDDVEGWILEQAKNDGPPSYWLSDVAVGQEHIRRQEDGTLTVGPLQVTVRPDDASGEAGRIHRRFLLFRSSRSPYALMAVPVAAGGSLDRLRRLCERLSQSYLWYPSDAVMFVLTGDMPEAVRYAHALQEGTHRFRELSDKHKELAAFTEEHAGEPLQVRMNAWNAAYPDWSYARVTNFGYDSKQAVARVLGLTRDQQDVIDEARWLAMREDTHLLHEILEQRSVRRVATGGKRMKANKRSKPKRAAEADM